MMRRWEVMPLFLLCISLSSARLEDLRATESLSLLGSYILLQSDGLLAGKVLTRKLIRRTRTCVCVSIYLSACLQFEQILFKKSIKHKTTTGIKCTYCPLMPLAHVNNKYLTVHKEEKYVVVVCMMQWCYIFDKIWWKTFHLEKPTPDTFALTFSLLIQKRNCFVTVAQ